MGRSGDDGDEALATAVSAASPRGSLSDDLAGLATLLEAVAATPGARPVGPALPPGPFAGGAFDIERKLGAGGMGVVYLARDTQLDRPVAIKLPAARGDVDVDRMRREATAMARLTHPNVVRVYEVDSAGDQLFIVMEYMAGGTLRRWLRDEARTREQILAAFAAVGDGLAAAHDAGIAHRDFKPDNVFMADDGRPCVADFGLARGVDSGDADPAATASSSGSLDARLTATGATLGTPRYMAPEQFDGAEVDARADQFSYCVALYEALYDQHPFGGDSAGELRERVRSGVVLPGRPDRPVPRRLRRILERGLATDPDDRYPDMRALLAALRATASRRRHPARYAAVGAAAAAVVAAGVWLAGSGADAPCTGAAERMAGVWDPAVRARAEAGVRATGLAYAGDVWNVIGDRLDGYRDDWVATHTRVCRATRVSKERSESALDASMTCLEVGRARVAKLASLLGDADGEIVASAVESVDALGAPSECASLTAARSPLRPPPEDRAAVLAIRAEIGGLRSLVAMGRYPPAEELAEALVDRARAVGFRPLLAETLYNVGLVRRYRDGYAAGAVASFEEALNVAYAAGYDAMVADAVAELTLLAGTVKRNDDADRWFQMGLAAIERLGGDTGLEAALRCSYVTALRNAGRNDRAVAEAETCLRLSIERSGPEHHDVAIALHNLAVAHMATGDYQGAADAAGRAVSILEARNGRLHRRTAGALGVLGVAEMRLGKLEAAEEHLRAGLAVRVQLFGGDDLTTAGFHNNLHAVLVQRGKAAEALEHAERSAAIERERLAGDPTSVAATLGNLAIANVSNGKLDRALDLARESLAIFRRAHPDGAADLVNAHTLYGTLLRYKGETGASLEQLHTAVTMAEGVFRRGHPQKVNPLIELGHSHAAAGDHDAAISVLTRAVTLAGGPNVPPPWVAEAKFALARSLRARERRVAYARKLAVEARDGYAALGQGFGEQVADIDAWLAAR